MKSPSPAPSPDAATSETRPLLDRGDLLPEVVVPPPGPRSREIARRLAHSEAPVVNTLVGNEASVVWAEALGACVLDVDGNRFLDLTSGFGAASVGHRHPRVVAAVSRQASRLVHGLGDVAAHPARIGLAEALAGVAPVDDARVYFAVSGSDAVEIALKTAYLATGRAGVLAFEPAYHGLSLGALAVTSRASFRQPFAPLLRQAYRLPFGCPVQELESFFANQAGQVGCVIVEPLVGREGVLLPPAGWLAHLAELCRERGALFVADEIFTGCGRAGVLFVSEEEGARPDLLCCGKGLGGGWPIGAVLGRREVMEVWNRPGEALHTGTFLAHPLSCAAALAVLALLEEEDLPARARRLGAVVQSRAAAWCDLAAVRAVRGRGLLWGVELAQERLARRCAGEALGAGLLLLVGGAAGQVLQLAPPLTIEPQQLQLALDVLETILEEASAR